MFTILSRDEARAKGLPKFFTGSPCRNGHVDQRYVKQGACVACQRCCSERFRKAHPKEHRGRTSLWRANNPTRNAYLNKRSRYKCLYNTTPEQVELQRGSQDDKCAGCRVALNGKGHADHDHATGQFRGLLCKHCNWGLGHLKDNIETLARLAAYLSES